MDLQAETSAMQELLKSNTESAIAAGAFGLPYIQAFNVDGHTETFWGFDHLGLVADFLGFARPNSSLSDSIDAGWTALL